MVVVIGREYSVEVRAGGRVSVRRFRAVSAAHARAMALDAFPVVVAVRDISMPETCPHCGGRGMFEDESGLPYACCVPCRSDGWIVEPCCPEPDCGPHPAGERHDEFGRMV